MKKLLALVLALVMVMGLSVVSANAAEYTDANDITYKEAADIMSAIGVFDGMDGAFNPKGILTREQGAKIIAYMILGKTAADSLNTASSPFTDVAANRWSAGAIAYCASENIVGGVGGGLFNPEAQLTGHQFAKMLLVALGYDPILEGLGGDTFAINTSKLAFSSGLTEDLEDVLLSQPLTRDRAAKMAFNAETATMVEYSNGVNVSTSDGTQVTVDANRSNVENRVSSYYYAGRAGEPDNSATLNTMQFCEKYATKLKFDDTGANTADKLGRPANTWRYDGKSVSVAAKTPTLTYTKAVTGKALYNDLGRVNVANIATVRYFIDGEDQIATAGNDDAVAAAKAAVAAEIVSGNTDDFGATGNGVLTEVYYNSGASTLDIVLVNTYVAKVLSDYNTKKEEAVIAVNNAAVYTDVKKIAAEDFEVAKTLKKDDVLLLHCSEISGTWEIIDVMAPTAVKDVAISGYKAQKNLTAGGTTYEYGAAIALADIDGFGGDEYADPTGYTLQSGTYDLCLDQYGYLVATSVNTGSASTATNYLFVKDVDGATFDVLAKVVFMDGTSKTVTISKVDNADAEEAGANATAELLAEPAAKTVYKNCFYKYSTDSKGNYKLTTVETQGNVVDAYIKDKTTTPIYKYVDETETAQDTESYANSKTTVVAKSTAYTGVANIPKVGNKDNTTTVYYLNNGNVLLCVYANAYGDSAAGESYFVFANPATAKTADGDDYLIYDVVKDGEVATLNIDEAVDSGYYKFATYDSNGFAKADGASVPGKVTVAKAVVVTDEADPAEWIKYSEGTYAIKNGDDTNSFILTSDATIYQVENRDGKTHSVSTIAPATLNVLDAGTYNVYSIGKASDNKLTVEELYIVRVDAVEP